MSDTGIARVYARALFEAASAADTVERTGDDLRAFVRALEQSPPLANVVFNPQIEPEAKLRVLDQLDERRRPLAAGVLAVLLEKGRITLRRRGRRRVRASGRCRRPRWSTSRSRRRCPSRPKRAPHHGARTRARPAASRASPSASIPPIIGGLVLRVGDVIIDGSLRARLQQLDDRCRTADVRGGDK